MSDLIAAIGRSAVLTLSRTIGGRTLHIPRMRNEKRSVEARARLIALVGAPTAEALILHFAGFRIYIPRGPSPHNSRACPISLDDIRRLSRRRGMTADKIAQALGCSTRTIHAKRAKLRNLKHRKAKL